MKNKKLRIADAIGIMVLIAVVASITIFWSIHRDPYAIHDDKNRLYGEMQHDTEFKEGNYYVAFYYPKTEFSTLNDVIKHYRIQVLVRSKV
ncbi:MAG: hypothetical protein ACLTDX_09055 [[Clostridium] innocuum]|nr:hypothetical protein [[Clostridium] innocuum]